MPHHRCLDPQDPYAQREVLVAYEVRLTCEGPRLLAAGAEDKADILPELTEVQRDDLRLDLAQALCAQALAAPASRRDH